MWVCWRAATPSPPFSASCTSVPIQPHHLIHRKPDNVLPGGCYPRDAVASAIPSQLLRDSVNCNDADPTLYLNYYLVIMAYSIDGDIAVFNYLYLYFYNAYFSIIVFKLASKILEKYRQALYYKFYRFIMHIIFIIYAALVLAALAYRIVEMQ